MVATPNYQGMFLRGYGSQTYTDAYGTVLHSSESLNVIQGDTIRELTGSGSFKCQLRDQNWSTGCFTGENYYGPDWGSGNASSHVVIYTMNLANNVPTSNENRPINMSVKYLIKAK